MIKVMGAPVDEAGARAIKDYLTKNYVQLERIPLTLKCSLHGGKS